jgi:hypothetical protein
MQVVPQLTPPEAGRRFACDIPPVEEVESVTGWRPMEPLATPEATSCIARLGIHENDNLSFSSLAAGGTRWLSHPAFRALTGVEAILMPHRTVPMFPLFHLAYLTRLIAPFPLSFL